MVAIGERFAEHVHFGHVVTLDGRAVDDAGGVYVTGRGTMLIRERQEAS